MGPMERTLAARVLDSRVLGAALILSSLTADVILTAMGKTAPALVASVCTAGIGMVSAPVWRRKSPEGG